jgi:putative ATPase
MSSLDERHWNWSERYRPKEIDDYIFASMSEMNERIVRKLHASDSMKNALYHGPPASGKSTIAWLTTHMKGYVTRPMNGSLMGKDDIYRLESWLRYPSFSGRQKVLLIDESDGITVQAQQAMRALIEQVPEVAWVLTCNERSKIIAPVQSRIYSIECRFPHSMDDRARSGLLRRCQQVLDAEQIAGVSDDDVLEVIAAHYPDCRRMLNTLQLLYEPARPCEHSDRDFLVTKAENRSVQGGQQNF